MATAARTRRTRKKGPDLFLGSLRTTGNVGLSCTAASIGRSTVYEWRGKDEAFASAWADALEEAADVLLAEARRRAIEGVEEPIMHQGQVVTTVRRYSDLLLIFLLKSARRRDFDPSGYIHLKCYEELEARMKEFTDRLQKLQQPQPHRVLR